MLLVNGATGEGGGQVLRTSLTLSMCRQQPFRIENIRRNRKKRGLLPQHLTCVQAAVRICGGRAHGAALGSTELSFEPGPVQAGNYTFDIGGAGSVMLVLQTVLYPLLFADAPSSLLLRGGTHNPLAPSFEFIQHAFLPLLKRMGADIRFNLVRHGFYPRGGGEIQIHIEPLHAFNPLCVTQRGGLRGIEGGIIVADLPRRIGEREAQRLKEMLGSQLDLDHLRIETLSRCGPGNVISLQLQYEHVCEVVTAYGRKGLPAEAVAEDAAAAVQRYISDSYPVGGYLADQLLLPLFFAQQGEIITAPPSPHTMTNMEIIQHFTGTTLKHDANGQGRYRIHV